MCSKLRLGQPGNGNGSESKPQASENLSNKKIGAAATKKGCVLAGAQSVINFDARPSFAAHQGDEGAN